MTARKLQTLQFIYQKHLLLRLPSVSITAAAVWYSVLKQIPANRQYCDNVMTTLWLGRNVLEPIHNIVTLIPQFQYYKFAPTLT